MSNVRTILHVDLDAFYASVEQRDAPELRGKPVIVGGPSTGRGVVSACSYEARALGVRSAMPMVHALRLAPSAVVCTPRMAHYAEVSRAFFAILDRFSPVVEGLSLDEAFLEFTGSERLLGDPISVARRLKQTVCEELGLVVSVGIAPSKFVAKIASDIDKPNGLRVVAPADVLTFLHPLPVSRLWGVGAVAERELRTMGLPTIGAVARCTEQILVRRFGHARGSHLYALAHGRDARAVVPGVAAQSVGQQETFAVDQTTATALEPHLRRHADTIAARLRKQAVTARTITLIVKYDDFKQVTRRCPIVPCADADVIAHAALAMLPQLPVSPTPGQRVRLCGIAASDLQASDAPAQLRLPTLPSAPAATRAPLGLAQASRPAAFPSAAQPGPDHVPPERAMASAPSAAPAARAPAMTEEAQARRQRLAITRDAINEKFGDGALHRASSQGHRRLAVAPGGGRHRPDTPVDHVRDPANDE